MRPLWLRVLALSLSPALVAACSDDETARGVDGAPSAPPPVEPAPGEKLQSGALAPAACRFAVPRSAEGKSFSCFDLAVPENRDVSASRSISVHVAVFAGKQGGVPTFELNGGPGASAEGLVEALSIGDPRALEEMAPFLALGDLVLFDQRGTGRSKPRLGCGSQEDDLEACARELTRKGVDLTGYVTREIADDVHDLAAALGAPRINLHSISYGTRLALEILRRHPGDVGNTVIDGVLPGQARLLSDGVPNVDALITHVFTACAADAKCDVAYPDLEGKLTALKVRLDATPFESKLYGYPYDWSAFTGELSQRLYAEGEAGHLPFLILDYLGKTQAQFDADEAALAADDEKAFEEMDASMRKTPLGAELADRMAADPELEEVLGGTPLGMYMSVVCSDHGQYESLTEALAAEAKVRPELRNPGELEYAFEGCSVWPRRAKTPEGLAPIASDRPVLVVGGEVDPATPLAWAKAAAATLSASQLVEMKGGAHGAMDACALGLKTGFLATGKPVDTACTQGRALTFFYPKAPSFAPRPHLTGGSSARAELPPVRMIASPAARARLRQTVTRALRGGRNRR